MRGNKPEYPEKTPDSLPANRMLYVISKSHAIAQSGNKAATKP